MFKISAIRTATHSSKVESFPYLHQPCAVNFSAPPIQISKGFVVIGINKTTYRSRPQFNAPCRDEEHISLHAVFKCQAPRIPAAEQCCSGLPRRRAQQIAGLPQATAQLQRKPIPAHRIVQKTDETSFFTLTTSDTFYYQLRDCACHYRCWLLHRSHSWLQCSLFTGL